MASPHKYAEDGLELATSMSAEDVWEICALAASESSGDHWNGKGKVLTQGRSEGIEVFGVRSMLQEIVMLWGVSVEQCDGYTEVVIEIVDYSTIQSTYMFIPVSPKRMVMHNVYMQFIGKLQATVLHHDPGAWVFVRSAKTPMPRPPRPPHLSPAGAGAPAVAPMAPPPARVTGPSLPPNAQHRQPPEELEDTLDRPLRPANSWYLEWEGHGATPITRATVCGRNPVAGREHGDVDVLMIGGPGADQISKTHVLVVPQGAMLLVTDLGSTNGVTIVRIDGSESRCAPGVSHSVMAGDSMLLGAYRVRPVRGPVG